ncbi:MAG TPA: ubiquinol-cytochrome C chaperone family protein, partial [Stellaceae bacterium]|nr:ubiquinol-cytochrome C chaperone family protein [Stellaceae bacterium]
MIFASARNCAKVAADIAYQRVIEQARQPVFFTDYGVPDTLDGRFELICVHAFLYLHRLKAERPRASRLCQGFFDRMFADFDRSLRELGVGDLSVGKHVKRMARAFYGRIVAYEEGLAGGTEVLGAAVSRNVFGTVAGPACAVEEMASYIQETAEELHRQPAAELLAGRVAFTPPGLPT